MRTARDVLVYCLLLSPTALLAADGWHSLGNVSGVKLIPQGVELTAGTSRVRIVALSPNVLRVRYSRPGEFPADRSFAVLPHAFPDAPSVNVKQSPDAVMVATNALQVKILRSPLRILFLKLDDSIISQDQPGFPTSFNGSGFRVWKAMPEDEHYFALGDKSGPLDHRNLAFTIECFVRNFSR